MKTLILKVLLFSVPCLQARAELVPISNGAIRVSGKHCLDRDEGVSRDYLATGPGGSCEFVTHLGSEMADNYRGPFLLMAEAGSTFDLQDEPSSFLSTLTWRGALKYYQSRKARLYLSTALGFTYASYGREPARLLADSLEENRLPPLMMVADNGGQILALWHRASGMEFEYDTASVDREIAELKEKADEQKALETFREQACTTFPSRGPRPDYTPRHRPRLMMVGGGSIESVMMQLGDMIGCQARRENGKWKLVPRSAMDIEQSASRLAGILRDRDCWREHSSARAALSRLGAPAVPHLTPLLNAAVFDEEPEFYRSIVYSLADIPTAERDAAFIRELEVDRSSFYWDYNGRQAMIVALGRSRCHSAVPVLRKAWKKSKSAQLRQEAYIALCKIGSRPPDRLMDQVLRINPAVASAVQSPEHRERVRILQMVIESGLVPDDDLPTLLDEIEVLDGNQWYSGTTYSGCAWSVRLDMKGGIVEVTTGCGPWSAAGCGGAIQMIGNEWVLTRWTSIWAS